MGGFFERCKKIIHNEELEGILFCSLLKMKSVIIKWAPGYIQGPINLDVSRLKAHDWNFLFSSMKDSCWNPLKSALLAFRYWLYHAVVCAELGK